MEDIRSKSLDIKLNISTIRKLIKSRETNVGGILSNIEDCKDQKLKPIEKTRKTNPKKIIKFRNKAKIIIFYTALIKTIFSSQKQYPSKIGKCQSHD